MLAAVLALADERSTAEAERRLSAIDPSGSVGSTLPDDVTTRPDRPPRAQLADALALARLAPHDRSRLDLAMRLAATSAAARPHWGEAWAARAYLDALRQGE
jgi:hypothetical protein